MREPRFPNQYREVYVFVKILNRFRVYKCVEPDITVAYINAVISLAENEDFIYSNPLRGYKI